MSDSWIMHQPQIVRFPLSLGLPPLQLQIRIHPDLRLDTSLGLPFSVDYFSPIAAPAAVQSNPMGLALPLEQVGGVTCLRPTRALPLVLSGATLPLDTVGANPGVGVGLSFRFDDQGYFGLFASVTNAPVVGSLSLGYSPQGYIAPQGEVTR
jgi:hypothetical protein